MNLDEKFFTVVFSGDIAAIKSNPMKLETAFGEVQTISRGDLINSPMRDAAPEMYDALEQHQAFLERIQSMVTGGSDISDVDFSDLFNAVLALSDYALSKARGEQP